MSLMNFLSKKRADARAGSGPNSYPVEGCVLTDVGCVRDENQDSVLLVRGGCGSAGEPLGSLLIVADGMGGHRGGSTASRTAVECIRDYYTAHCHGTPQSVLAGAVRAANQAIQALAARHPEYQGMGTTVSVLLLQGDRAFVAHVGDSRIYRLRDGQLQQLTQDHTVVAEMLQAGLISAEQARAHPDRNLISRAVGTRPQVEAQVGAMEGEIRPGDRFLACSDGLHDLVREDELAATLASREAYAACVSLIEMAKARSGHDNISVGILEVASPRVGRADPRATRAVPATRPARFLIR